MLRKQTRNSHREATSQVRALLELAPSMGLDEAVRQIPFSRSKVQRAFRAEGTSFRAERRALQLDRAAQNLLWKASRGQREGLINAGLVAGESRARHLCAPFRMRYGLTPGEVWRLGVAMRGLRS